MKTTKIFDVDVIVIEKDKIKIPKTILGVTYITRGTLNAKDLDSNAKKLILKHELYHQLTHRKKMFLAVITGIFIISFCVNNFIGREGIFVSSMLSLIISIFSMLLLTLSINYENEIQADLFAAKELGKNKAVTAIKTIQNSELGRKMEHWVPNPFHKLAHPTLEQRLILFKEN